MFMEVIIAKLKNKNGGLIQDGDENIFFIFHIISRHFDFLSWQQCFYFYIALELQHIKK
jgi:hypothetical protein